MNGLSSLRSHRRASSGERARERDSGSASHHRLSTYDNVSSCSSLALSGGGAGHEGGGGADGSTSSCEISVSVSPPDSAIDRPTGSEPQPQIQPHGQQGAMLSPTTAAACADPEEAADASVAVEMCVSSGECSFSISGPAEDSDDSSPSLSNLVGGLKEELRKQKMVYEARIQK